MNKNNNELKKSLYKATKQALEMLYSRNRKSKGTPKSRKGFDPVDDVLDADFKAEAEPSRVPPSRSGVLNKGEDEMSEEKKEYSPKEVAVEVLKKYAEMLEKKEKINKCGEMGEMKKMMNSPAPAPSSPTPPPPPPPTSSTGDGKPSIAEQINFGGKFGKKEKNKLKKYVEMKKTSEDNKESSLSIEEAVNHIMGDKKVHEVMPKVKKEDRRKVLASLRGKDIKKAVMCKSYLSKCGESKEIKKSKEDLKGVHKPIGDERKTKGVSDTGVQVRGAKDIGKEKNAALRGLKDMSRASAKSKHKKVLREMKDIKPDLPKSENIKKRCWKGHKPVKGKKPYEKGSCEKE